MRHPFFLRFCIALFICFVSLVPAHAADTTYRTATTRWRASSNEFGPWQRSGVNLPGGGRLTFDPAASATGSDPYPAGGYFGGNFYNGGSFRVGEATGPIVASTFAFKEAVASWNAATPAGSWMETQLRAKVGDRWTKWYNMGVWAADS